MLYEVDWAPDGTYRPGSEYSPERFYDECLHNSTEFDLQLGYFSSAAISVLADGFASFVSRGGKMRLVINHIVSQQDKDAITKGFDGDLIDIFDLSDFEQLKATFDEYTQQFFDCLAFLIKQQRIEIRIIRPRDSNGISHYKSGQFRDGDSITSFDGSANFTIGGIFNNLEHIKIERSDSIDIMVQNSIRNARREFEDIMNHKKKGIAYLTPDDLVSVISSNFGDKDIEELLDVEKKLREIRRRRKEEEMMTVSEDMPPYGRPSFPYPAGPHKYQQQAFESWKSNGQKGLFAMATGTGKTITSLNCLLEIYQRRGYYKALILVPTITLVNQWEKECRKFHFNHIIKVFSQNSTWKNEVSAVIYNERFQATEQSDTSYIIISTYASYIKERVFRLLNSLNPKRLLLIADECHNMGAAGMLKRLKEIPYGRRIGLSATPERQYDDYGNAKLRFFFGVEDKYTFEYTMGEAIDNGVLCRYYYYPHVVRLTPDETERYMELSKKIAKYFNYSTGTFDKQDDILTALLLARKRIVHKAENKLHLFRQIIAERFREYGSLKYTLVYVPEGNEPDYLKEPDLTSTKVKDDEEAIHLINLFTAAVSDVDKYVTVKQFVSGSKERDRILADFAKGDIQVLTSMKCLDEGVDVPRSEMAIFCASTGNPRQFIQRRGRILRTHKDKSRAYIHDMVVVPDVTPNSPSYPMERSLLKTELERVRDFALLSENAGYTEIVLADVMDYYDLNLYNNKD